MPEPVQIVFTVQDQNIFRCVQCKNGYTQFLIKPRDAGIHIGLFTAEDVAEDTSLTNPKYVIKLGLTSSRSESVVTVFEKDESTALKTVSVPFILDDKEWRGFWVHVSYQTILFGRENECEPIISWEVSTFRPIIKIGFRVQPHLYHDFYPNDRPGEVDVVVDSMAKLEPTGVRWVKYSNGEVPESAFEGGHDCGNTMYVIRAVIRGALTPGKLRSGTTSCEISWGGRENSRAAYEVLTDFDGDWIKTREDNIPPLAVLAGRTEDNCPLYIGRTNHQGTVTVGKVQPSHSVLYIPFRGEELAFKEYEILCHKPPGPPIIPRPLLETDRERHQLKWVYSCNGRVPRNAFVVSSHQGQAVVLIRAKYERVWLPGWLCYSESADGHVAGSFFRLNVEEYDVLCDFFGHWEKPTAELNMPTNAVVIHKDGSEDVIYVGRALHKGRLLCGAVIDNRCRISYDNEQISKDDFEVLCHPNYVESATKNGLLADFRR